jgi:glycosyltransferase involved in cell wall biosynthesis
MKFSAVWITKNEEENILNSIHSVKNAVDELIVVDTGSTDTTVELSRKAGARVEFFSWRDDFSAARNYALNHAAGDIIIFLDADEFFAEPLTKEDRKTIEKLFEDDPNLDAIHSFIFSLNNAGVPFNIMRTMRILRKNIEFSYSGIIHEIYLATVHQSQNRP